MAAYSSKKDYSKSSKATSQAAQDKRVQERRAANKKAVAERKAKRKAARAEKKAAKKPVSVEKTKGGDYPVYKKKSAKAESFRSKFAKASSKGKKTFKWKGRLYTTEKAVAKPKKAAPKSLPKKIKPKVKPKSSPKWHAPMAAEKSTPSPIAPKEAAPKKAAPKKGKPTYEELVKPYIEKSKESKKMAGGGKVECDNAFGWPSRDARSGGKK